MTGDAHLISLLPAPANFVNVSNADEPGSYLFGNADFRVRELRITPLLHRSFAGAQEDLVLGVVCVILIALLSEIVQTLLLRRARQGHVPQRGGLHAAYAVDQLAHFRNVWDLATRRRSGDRQRGERRLAVHSLIIVLIAAALLAAEVIAVYLTQPYRVYTGAEEYNLKGVQPAGTRLEIASAIDLLTAEKTCITPSMKDSNQTREYTLSACVMRQEQKALDEAGDYAEWVSVQSWYHSAGSDHRIDYGNGADPTEEGQARGSFNISQRAIIMQGQYGLSRAILFDTTDGHDMKCARYLQTYMMYTAIQWICDKSDAERTCLDMKKELDTQASEPEFVTRNEVKVWDYSNHSKDGFEGIKMDFKIKLNQPYHALQQALNVLTTSSIIREVEGPAMYFDVEKEKMQRGMKELASEEGRIAGVIMLCAILAVMLVILIILRYCLRPLSLARIARDAMDDVYDDLEMAGEEFVGTRVHPQLSSDTFELSSPTSDRSSSDAPPSTSSLKKFLSLGRGKKRRPRDAVTDIPELVADVDAEYESTVTSTSSQNSMGR